MYILNLLKHDSLPTIRIKKVVLNNFKSVAHGEIVFNCGRSHVPYGTESDILGVYGQNGSGKTALIEALSILRQLMVGSSVGNEYADCIAINAENAELKFWFDLQYPNGEIREVLYAFQMKREKLSDDEIAMRMRNFPEGTALPDSLWKVCVFNEQITMSWTDEDGTYKKSQKIIDTSTENAPFGPAPKRKYFFSGRKEKLALEISKSKAYDNSQSFIFREDTLKIFSSAEIYSVFYQVILELSYFAGLYFYVIDTKSTGFIRLNFAIPVYTRTRPFLFKARQTDTLSNSEYAEAEFYINGISTILNQLVPGLTIELKKLGTETIGNGEEGNIVSLVAYRNGEELPLRDESDGIRKIISVLSLIAAAFASKSCTVAIDEFDAGIYEYLLGEILEIFEEEGKGQFIFTSHNLRPLEVIDKKHLYFTTTNPQNRFIRLKGIGACNNLRDVYFREIQMNEQSERIYNKTKRHRIIAALIKAGSEEEMQ